MNERPSPKRFAVVEDAELSELLAIFVEKYGVPREQLSVEDNRLIWFSAEHNERVILTHLSAESWTVVGPTPEKFTDCANLATAAITLYARVH